MCAKVTSPLMSLDASGSIASALTFSKWKGRNYARQLVIPANPQTEEQQGVRAKLGSAGRFNSFIGPLSDAQIAVNEASPADTSGVAFYAKQQISRFEASSTDYNDEGNSTEKGLFDTKAGTLGLQAVTIPGGTPLVVPAGLILWNAYQTMHFIDDELAPTEADSATSGNIDTFIASLTAS